MKHKLYKDRRLGVIGGVCAGLADYFGLDLKLVRILYVLGLFFFFPLFFLGYIVLLIALEQRPDYYMDPEEKVFWRDVSHNPKDKMREMKLTFERLNSRISRIEDTVTSSEYEWKKKLHQSSL